VSFWETQLLSVVVAVATGVFSSFAVWWWLTRRLRPKIEICPTLAVFTTDSGYRATQCRIRNQGKRPVHDIDASVSIRMPSLIRKGVAEWAFLQHNYMPVLAPGDSRRWSIRPERSESLLRYKRRLPTELMGKFGQTGRIEVRDLLRAVPGTEIRIAVFATDSYSKTRDYQEKRIPLKYVLDGRFIGNTCEQASPAEEAATGSPEMGDRGFEPRTSALSERRSNRLS
jgi:hypothetical protein